MRNACIKSFNRFYKVNNKLKTKQKGRNQDINVKDMGDYKQFKEQYEKNVKKLDEANKETDKLNVKAKEVDKILDNLKPTTLNKNNRIISNEDIDKIKKLTEDVKDTTKTIRNVNDLNILMDDFGNSYYKLEKDNDSLTYQISLKDEEINNLKKELSMKDKIIDKLQSEKENIKEELYKFKGFWHSLMQHFQNKIFHDKDTNFMEVAKNLIQDKIFGRNEEEIVKNPFRKIRYTDFEKRDKTKKKNNLDLK